MRINYIFFISVFFITNLLSQDISFSEEEILFTHPNDNYDRFIGAQHPFIPLDFNNDGLWDYVGGATESLFQTYTYILTSNSEADLTRDSIDRGDIDNGAIQVLDFNGDGNLDVLLDRTIYFPLTQDEFTIPPPDSDEPIVPTDLYIGAEDFNGDGQADVVTHRLISNADNELAVFLSNTEGEFDNVVLELIDDLGDIDITDIDNDGDLDLIVLEISDLDATGLLIFENDGQGNFSDPIIPDDFAISFANIFGEIKAIDLDGDQDKDFVYGTSNELIYLINESTPDDGIQFSMSIGQDFDNPLILYQFADMNNDGLGDMVGVGIFGGGELQYLENNGDLTFKDPVDIATRIGSPAPVYTTFRYSLVKNGLNISIFDFDNDSDLDIVYTNGENGTVSLYRSDFITSSQEEQIGNSVALFPNPAADFISLVIPDNLKVKELIVRNILGYKMAQVSGANSSDGNYQISVADLPSGLYTVQDDESKFIVKFFKK